MVRSTTYPSAVEAVTTAGFDPWGGAAHLCRGEERLRGREHATPLSGLQPTAAPPVCGSRQVHSTWCQLCVGGSLTVTLEQPGLTMEPYSPVQPPEQVGVVGSTSRVPSHGSPARTPPQHQPASPQQPLDVPAASSERHISQAPAIRGQTASSSYLRSASLFLCLPARSHALPLHHQTRPRRLKQGWDASS